MQTIAFIGLGNMGQGMAANQVRAGRTVQAFDLSAENLKRAEKNGCKPTQSVAAAVAGAEAIITMLPAGAHLASVYGEVIGAAPAG